MPVSLISRRWAPEVVRRRVLWPGLIVLVAIGIALAMARAWAITTDQSAFAALAQLLPDLVVREGMAAERWYATHGRLTLIHILPGALLLLAVPLQFVPGIRRRRPRLHRWLGRTLLAIALPTALSGLLLGGLSPFGGLGADSAIGLFGAVFLLALVRGYRAARRRDFVRHREWMLRMVSIAVGIATVRLVALPLFWLTRRNPVELVGPTFWLGLALSCATAEIWIRYSRPPGWRSARADTA